MLEYYFPASDPPLMKKSQFYDKNRRALNTIDQSASDHLFDKIDSNAG